MFTTEAFWMNVFAVVLALPIVFGALVVLTKNAATSQETTNDSGYPTIESEDGA